jgi:hypothetical protein
MRLIASILLMFYMNVASGFKNANDITNERDTNVSILNVLRETNNNGYHDEYSCLSLTNQTRNLKRLPNAIIIGVKKSGTYALIRYLSINPQIKAALKINNCELNEIHYFDNDINYLFKGKKWYKEQMPNICQNMSDNNTFDRLSDSSNFVVIEKTPGYFRNQIVPKRMFTFDPNLKLILITRDPVRRIQSELTHCDTRQRKFKLERKCLKANDFFENLFNATNNNFALLNETLVQNKFVRNSIYYLDMREWLKHFSIKNFFVLDGESFIRRPWFELARLEKFLNVSRFIQKEHFHFDKNKNFYCMNTSDDTTQLNGCLGRNKGRKNHVYLSAYTKDQLSNYFRSWNKLFFQLIGHNFSW